MKAMPSEEWEMILQHCLMVLRFIFQEIQVSFQFRKTTEDIWSGWSFGQSQHPADAVPCRCWALNPAACSKAQLFWISCSQCAQLYTSALSYKWIHMSHHSNESHEKRPAFIVDGISSDLDWRHTRALHGHIFQREFLNRRRRNLADKANFAKLPRGINIDSQKYI